MATKDHAPVPVAAASVEEHSLLPLESDQDAKEPGSHHRLEMDIFKDRAYSLTIPIQ